jgi:hypothetical protein
MPTLLTLLLLTAFPSASQTSWMTPEAFHLSIGMPRAEVDRALEKWAPKRGRDANELVVDYSDDKSLTLEFAKGRLHSVRFELFVFLPEVRRAFDERTRALAASFGAPPKQTKSVVIYDNKLPNVMVVVADDKNSEQGKKGIGVLAVRYYDPR